MEGIRAPSREQHPLPTVMAWGLLVHRLKLQSRILPLSPRNSKNTCKVRDSSPLSRSANLHSYTETRNKLQLPRFPSHSNGKARGPYLLQPLHSSSWVCPQDNIEHSNCWITKFVCSFFAFQKCALCSSTAVLALAFLICKQLNDLWGELE